MNKTRLEAFSDGVFAIIITIMVLELKIPEGTEWEVVRPLIPKFFSYLLSFVYIAIYWGNHHHLVHTAKHVTAGIMWANAHLLFWLSLIPFATGWMGENNFERVTVATYGAMLLACGAAYALLSTAHKAHPHRRDRTDHGAGQGQEKGDRLYAIIFGLHTTGALRIAAGGGGHICRCGHNVDSTQQGHTGSAGT